MPQIFFPAFLWTVPLGAVLFVIAWLPTRRLSHQSRPWRFLLSSIVALALTPTPLEVCGQQFLFPASNVSLMLLASDPLRRAMGMVYGILPLVTFASVVFCVWSYYVERARKVAS